MRKPESTRLTVPDSEAMRELGEKLGRALLAFNGPALCVALEGDLGAGKTTLVGGVLAAAGIAGPVRSPTYTLIEPYEALGGHFYHLDLYRLTDPKEIEPLGIRDLLVPGVILLIEWPMRAGSGLPPTDVWLQIDYPEPPNTGRTVLIEPRSPAAMRLLRHFLP